MIDIKLIRENRDLVKENIKKKFQDEKLPIVDEVYELDKRVREVQVRADALKADKNRMSGEIGKLMQSKKIEEANKIKEEISKTAEEIVSLEKEQEELISKLDVTQKYTQKQIQKYIDEMKSNEKENKNSENEKISIFDRNPCCTVKR